MLVEGCERCELKADTVETVSTIVDHGDVRYITRKVYVHFLCDKCRIEEDVAIGHKQIGDAESARELAMEILTSEDSIAGGKRAALIMKRCPFAARLKDLV